jgi:hypothetical protein
MDSYLRSMLGRRLRKLRPAAPALSYLPFSLEDMIESVRSRYFPNVPGPIPALFSTHKALACCWTSPGYPLVHIHHVLNHPQTPREVIEFICKHELLHFVIPPRIVGKTLKSHPPEFWVEEQRIAPESRLVWAWLHYNIGACLKARPQLEQLDVTSEWRKLELSPRSAWTPADLSSGLEGQDDVALHSLI